jgi:hypothetical protein
MSGFTLRAVAAELGGAGGQWKIRKIIEILRSRE